MFKKCILSAILMIMLVLVLSITVGAEEAKYSGAEITAN